MLVFRGSCPEAKGSCYCLSSGGRPSSVLIKRLGMASMICCTFFRSSSNLARHICLRDQVCINRLKAISEGLLHSHWSSGYYDECANSPIGRNNGTTFQHLVWTSDHYAEENIPVERPRITPIPAPVAIPFIRLLRIQGIRSKFSLSRSCRPILLLGQHWGPHFIQLRIEARTLKASTRSCQKLPVVSRWKMGGLSEDVRVSDGCFEDWVSVGWEFDMTVSVQDLRYFAHISSRASLSFQNIGRFREINPTRIYFIQGI